MIVIVNGAPGAGQDEVADRLVARMPEGAVVEPGTEVVATLLEEGIEDFVIPGVFPTWASLRELRRALAPLDSTSYAFRIPREPKSLSDEGLEVQRAQDREEEEGDVGLRVPDGSPEEAARFIWQDIHEPVELEPWSPRFRESFEREREAIRRALGDRVLALEHVGSTAVEGLEAKPIVDMVLAVPSLERTRDYLPALREIGYNFLDYPTNVDRYFFKKGRPRTHHLHVGERGTAAIEDQVRFRDALRARADLRERYAALKRDLERRFPADRARYSQSKGAFVAEVLRSLSRSARAPTIEPESHRHRCKRKDVCS